MKVLVEVYDSCKYEKGSKKVGEARYDIERFEVKQISDEEIYSMGEKTPFSIRTEAGWVENPVVIGEMPNGQKVVAFVGDAPWDDYKTYEEAVAGVIHSMARTARNIY